MGPFNAQFVFSPIAAAMASIVLYLVAAYVVMALMSRDHDGRMDYARLALNPETEQAIR